MIVINTMSQLYKLKIGEKLQFKYLSPEQYEELINKLKSTNYRYLKSNKAMATKDTFIEKLNTDDEMFKMFTPNITKMISSCDIYNDILSSWNIKLIPYNTAYTREQELVNLPTWSDIINYLNEQYVHNLHLLNRTTDADFLTSIMTPSDQNTNIIGFLLPYNLSDVSNIDKLPMISYGNIRAEHHNNKLIAGIIMKCISKRWIDALKLLIPAISNSFTHIKYLVDPYIYNIIHEFPELVDSSKMMKIYAVNEHVEILYKYRHGYVNDRVVTLDFATAIFKEEDVCNWDISPLNKTIITPPKLAHTLVNQATFNDRFNRITHGIFDTLIYGQFNMTDNPVGIAQYNTFKRRKSKTTFYFCGSIITQCAYSNSAEFDDEYINGDIDMVVYARSDQEYDLWVNKIFTKYLDAEVKLERVITSRYNYKWWAHVTSGPLVGKKIELFKSRKTLPRLISIFHVAPVRAYFDGKTTFCFNSFVESGFTSMINSMRLQFCKDKARYILHKYFRRGFQLRLTNADAILIMEYFDSLEIPEPYTAITQ